MTKAEADALVASFNTDLGEATASIKYGTVPRFNPDLTKDYNITLFASTYDAQFTAATESQKIAFARVMRATLNWISLNNPTATVAQIATQFATQAAADTELATYLGL